MEEECVYKILLLGDACTDKSLFLLRYTDKKFQDIHMATIGLDYRLKTMKLKKGKNIKLQIWDTAGQERFRAITKNYYKASHGIILLYDVTNLQSFENIKSWINQIREEASPNVVIYLVGSKIDLEEERKVTKKDGEKLAEEFGLPFLEASGKSGINVNEVFDDIVERIDDVYGNLSKKKTVIYKAKKKGFFNFLNNITEKNNNKAKELEKQEKKFEEIDKSFPEDTYNKFPKLKKYLNF